MGTIGLYVTEGGLSEELHGVGAVASFVTTSATFQTGYDVDVMEISNTTASGMLPFGAQIKLVMC